jgi:hypothetical protein
MSPEMLRTELIPKPLREAYAHHGDRVDDAQQLAAIADLPTAEVEAILADPVRMAELEAYRTVLEAKGKLRQGRLDRMVDKVLGVIDVELQGNCDIDTALELIKPLIRLTEISEKSRLAEREINPFSNLPVFNITINGGAIQIKEIPASSSAVTDVIDATVVVIPTLKGGA